MEKQQFIYYSSPDNDLGARVTVVGEYADGVLNLAVARCSNMDAFVKKTGREIATERLKKGEFVLSFKSETMSFKRFFGVASAVAYAVAVFNIDVKIELIEKSKLFLDVNGFCFQAGEENSFAFVKL